MNFTLKPVTIAAATVLLCVPIWMPDACAQTGGVGGRGRGRGDGGQPQNQPRSEKNDARLTPPVTDPMAAIEREMPSLRLDLKLDHAQSVLFDTFQRTVREAADAARNRTRRLSAFKLDDGSTVSASSIIMTLAETEKARADAVQAVQDKMETLYNTFNTEQRRMFDRRVMQSQREPLGNS